MQFGFLKVKWWAELFLQNNNNKVEEMFYMKLQAANVK